MYILNQTHFEKIFSGKVYVSGEPPDVMHTNVLWLLAKRFTFILLWQMPWDIWFIYENHVACSVSYALPNSGFPKDWKNIVTSNSALKVDSVCRKGTSISSSGNMLCGLYQLHLVLCIHFHYKFAFMKRQLTLLRFLWQKQRGDDLNSYVYIYLNRFLTCCTSGL